MRASPLPRHSSRLASITIGLLVAAILLLAHSDAAAARKWKPRFAPKRQTVDRLVLTTDVQVSAKLPLIGGPEGTLHLRIESTRRVAARKWWGPTSMELTLDRIAFDFDLAGRSSSFDSQVPGSGGADSAIIQDYAGLLLGRTLVLKVLRTGEIVDVQGVEDLYDDLQRLSAGQSALAPLLDSLVRDLGEAPLRALLQQSTPVFPGRRLRPGDTWSRETDVPNPLFESMRASSDYELQEFARSGTQKTARTAVSHAIRPEGQGPLLEQLGQLAGLSGELRLTEGKATGLSTIWSARKGGLTLGLKMQQSVRARLSVPVKVLGFTRRTNVPLKVDQRTTLEILDAR